MLSDSTEIGPFGIFDWIRANSWNVAGWVGEGMNCIRCMSFWIAGATTALFCAFGLVSLPLAFLMWPAISAGAILFGQLLHWFGREL